MFISVITSILLMASPVHPSDSLSITRDGTTITKINQMDFFYPYTDLPIMNTEIYTKFLDQLDNRVSLLPVNARLDQHGNIIPEQVGYKINRNVLTGRIYEFYFNKQPASIELPMSPVYPKVDSELLSEIRTMRIGRYVTSFNPSNKNRSTNIKIAAEAIDNYVVFPGETFSFNRVVGKRTKERGYLRAKVIVRGEYAEDIGGGICQVSSTLFNAVDNAGLEIVERFSHSKKVSYIPPGRDATVSWYGPDFVFKNTYNQPVLIRARTLGGILIIKIFSSESANYRPKKIPTLPY
ncbi:VanW family protein [Neobacillus niacini]|uniref:VanW family protein n=1 Tax=Neobacillus niacini TaxID=86668 RepID=UPI0021CB3A3D|nr:VanW family protein [Neobacillus niacini]MCM3768795.1 VanW family protein [Neobacillus niacini]